MGIIDTSNIDATKPDDSDLQTQDLRDNFSAINTAFDAVNTRTATNKAAAVLLTPVADAMLFVNGSDGGLFKAVTGAAAATYSDNGGTYCGTQFIPTGGDGSSAWVRVYDNELLNVRYFGAVGDGTTDDTAAIQAAIDYAELLTTTGNLRGAVVYLEAGNYKVTSTLTVTTSRVYLQGDGETITQIARNTDYGDTIAFTNGAASAISNVGVMNMTITHDITTVGVSSGAHINYNGCYKTTTRNVNLIYGYNQLLIRGGAFHDVDNVHMIGTYVSADAKRNSLSGLKLTALTTNPGGLVTLATQVRVRHMQIGGALQASHLYCILIEGSEEVEINQSHCAHGQYNVYITQNALDEPILETNFTDCYFDANAVHNIFMTGSTATGDYYIGQTSFNACHIKAGGYGGSGLHVDGTVRAGAYAQATRGLTVDACHISANILHGINLTGCNNAIITNNEIKGNSYSSAGTYVGLIIGVAADRVMVSNNIIGGDAVGKSTGNQIYGIRIDNGCSDISVIGNDVENNYTASISDGSTTTAKIIENNKGYYDKPRVLANEATPTVINGKLFRTGGTTTITDFDDGLEGQVITILSEHAVTITDGTNIFLNGSANFVMASTDTLTLVQKSDGFWYEQSRSVN